MDSVDYKTLKKINELAESLKNNRIAANMDEAVEMAKNMLTKTPAGEQMSTDALAEMEKTLDEDEKELKKLTKEVDSLTVDKEIADEKHDASAAKQFVDEFDKTKKEVKEAKQEVGALSDMKKEASEIASKEKEAYKQEEMADEDLPGESEVSEKHAEPEKKNEE